MPGKRSGPKPLPANVLRLHGAKPGEVAKREAEEVRPHPVAPRRPKDLSPLERECWDLHAPELDRLGLLTVLDAGAFRMVCQSYAAAIAGWRSMAPEDRRRKGVDVVIDDPAHGGGLRRHPGFLIWKQAAGEYRAWCAEFGLSPSSRVGLRPGAPIGSVPDDEDDDAAFFGT